MSGDIFPGLPARHVESANARLEIRRDESQSGNRKKDQSHHDKNASIPWDDTAYVSVASLKAFLESMVTADPEDATPYIPPVHEARNTISQRAASAYQTIGRRGHDENVYTAPASTNTPASVETNFSEEDLARIRRFIHDLVELSRNGVTELAMQKSATFLDSIDAAIAAAKST